MAYGIKEISFEQITEGKCVQIMHIGPYSPEPETINMLLGFIAVNEMSVNGLHHEIYLSDPRKTAPEKMKNPYIKTCSFDTCNHCKIQEKTNCKFEISQLMRFYLISLSPFIIGGIFIYSYHIAAFYIWLFILGLFFLVIEIRVLCSHCPHYERSSFFLSCWANYGIVYFHDNIIFYYSEEEQLCSMHKSIVPFK